MFVFARKRSSPAGDVFGSKLLQERATNALSPAGARFHFNLPTLAPRAPERTPDISEPTDAAEREADALADAALRGTTQPPPITPRAATNSAAPIIQRKCDACSKEDDEQQTIMRKADGQSAAPAGAARAAAAIERGGSPLAPSVQSFFESRFQHDFSHVRIHDGAEAAKAAEGIQARAFTLGNHIAFARGAYAPKTEEGSKLLAHELAHVVQAPSRKSRISRQKTPVKQQTFQERGGGGTTDFEETVHSAPTQSGNIISGRVDRAEYAPATGTKAREQIHSGHVGVQFDTQNCTMTLPYKFNFVPQASVPPPICQDPPNATNVTQLSASEVQQIGQRYVNAINSGLRGQFTAKITGCKNKCADRDIEIIPNATISATNPDRTINVVNRGGRGDAATICAKDMSSGFAVHEGGHQLLGLGDEYREDDPGLRQRAPSWTREERVRTDLTYMGDHSSYGRFSLFHERHFRFAQVFLEAAFPGCSAQIEAVPRRTPDFRIDVLAGGAKTSSGSAMALGLGFNVGLPLTRLRQLELRLGAQGIALLDLDGTSRNALLAGATVGLEARTSPAKTAAIFGLFGSTGLYHQFASEGYNEPDVKARSSPYLEGGGSIGVSASKLGSASGLHFRLDAAFGKELTSNPDAMRWFRFGLGFGGTF